MKHTLYILFALLTAAISINAQQTDTLNEHDTWFQYQKDDGFEAFLLDRVDSIVYSRFDLDSVLHDDVVVQEVWFQGQVQRFLLETIDSIGFYKPETQYCDEVYHLTAFHVPYTIGIDSLTLTFDPSIPSDRLPLVGQVVVSDVRTHPYERGFAGRVRQINNTAEGIVLVCDRVSIVDIYKQLVAVGHVQATPDDDASNQPGNSRRRVNVEDETYDLITDKEISLPLKVMTIKDKINYSVDYTVNIGMFKKPIVKVYVNGRHELKGTSKLSVDDEKEWDVWPDKLSWYFPIPGLEILTVSLKLGGFAYAGGKMELKGEVPLTLTHQVGFEWEDNELTPIKSFDYEWGDPEVTLDLKGTVRAGIQMQLGINLISDGIVSANITGKIGPQLDADLVLSSDGVRDQSWYQALKDTKGTLSLYTSLDAAFEVFGNDIEDVLDISLTEPWEKNWLKTDRYLLPEFTQPELVPYTPDYADYSLTSMMTVPSRSTLLPVGVGIGMFDRGGNRIAEKWSGQWWTDDPEKPKKVQYDLSTAEGHRTHVFRPIVKLLGMTLDAYPEAEFTVPGKITLAENSVMMNEKTAKIIEITDGWGIYGNATDQQDIVKVSLYGELDGKHYLRLDALQAGETTVAVKDIRTGKTVSIPVKVVDPNALIVNPYNVTVIENQTADVTVKGGSGHYRVSTEDTEKIQAEIDGNTIHITALAPGEAIILVQDNQSDYFANIQVKINATPKSVYLAQSINMTAGDTRNIEISGKNGQVEIYKEADFINISSDNPDVATVRLVPGNTYYMVKVYALKEGVAHVTIEDTTTGDQSVMEVNVGPTSSITYTVTDGDYTTYTVNGVPFKMINVEGGTFTMGRTPEQGVDYQGSGYGFYDGRDAAWYNPRNKVVNYDNFKLDLPTHQETVTNFSIGETQVTWDLYKAVMGEGFGKDEEPITNKKNADIGGFISRLSEITKLPFRQPTETEWEYAARGGKYSKGYKYPGTNDVIAASFGVPNELGISGLTGGCNETCNEDYLHLGEVSWPYGRPRGGMAKVLCEGESRWSYKEIVPWTSYRFPFYPFDSYSDNGISLRLALGGLIAINRRDYSHLEVPLFGESSIHIHGGYGNFEVKSNHPEIAIGYAHGSEVTVQSISGGTATITVTDKKSGASLDFDAVIDYKYFNLREDLTKLPIGKEFVPESQDNNGRLKFNVSDESGVKLSMTPDKNVSIRGLKLGQYHVAITDVGSRETKEWDTEVIDTLGFDRNYITIREGHTDSVLVTHSNGMISVYCSKDDEYYNIIDESPNGYIYDNVIRITPTEPGVYGIRVNDYALDRVRLQGNYEKYITVIVPDERSEKREQVLSELDKTKILAIQTKKTLGSKATAEQAPDLYNTLFDINANIFCIGAKTESAKILPELEELEAQTENVRLKLNQLYEQVSQLSQLRTDEDVTEKDLCPDDHHPHQIDLGLPSGTKWACCNVGGNRVEEIGKYYFWGETEERTEYEYGTYQAPPIFDIEGTSYDVARVKWGEPWQMATNSQWDELLELKRTFTSRNGINGCLFEGNNGNAIFIPTVNSFYDYWGPTGYTGYYWSSTSFRHYYMGKDQLGYYDNMFLNGDFWCSIRPIVPSSGYTPDPHQFDQLKQALKTDLQTLTETISSIATELNNKATEEQAPKLYKEYRQLKSDCETVATKIESIASEDDVANCQAELKAITDKTEALRVKVENYQVSGVIVFADAAVKAICVANWDTDGDGELSYDEAAAVKELGRAFTQNTNCGSFNELEYFTGMTKINENAFRFCTALRSITLPSTITTIEDEAFSICRSLQSLTIPKSVISIGWQAISYCESLVSIDVDAENGFFSSDDGVLFNKDKTTIIRYPEGKTLTSYIIPNSVTTIMSAAFERCENLSSVTIPNSVININEYAFKDCSSLTSIVIPESARNISNASFSGCSNLFSIYVDEGNNNYASENGLLYNKDKTELLCYPAGKTDISFYVPENVKSFGSHAFDLCYYLKTIHIHQGFTSFGFMPIVQCNKLTNIYCYATTVPAASTSVVSSQYFTNITLRVPASVLEEYKSAGAPWDSFKDIVAIKVEEEDIITFTDANVKAICIANWDTNGDGELSYDEAAAVTDLGVAFKENSDITNFNELKYFTGLTSIGNKAFIGCSGLTSITIPNSATSIGNHAFYGCSGLTSIPIPNIVTSIGEYAFYHCSNLISVTIPNSVNSIGNFAFEGCSGLTTFIFGNSLNSIANGLLWGCNSLTSITIPNSVTNIGYDAFRECISLTSVTFGNSVTTIGERAFVNCSGLTSITIPYSVTSIHWRAFKDCTGLTVIHSEIENPFSLNCWENVDKSIPVYVPTGTKAKYKETEGWNEFTNIIDMGGEEPDPQQFDQQKQQLKADLQKAADELSSIETELRGKATEEQAPELYREYRQLKNDCETAATKIESITSEDDVANCQAELKAIMDKTEALRGKVNDYQTSSTAEVNGISYEITDNVKKEVEVISGRGEGLYFEISIPGSVKIGDELYNVVGLRERAFENTGVKSVTIAEGIKRIGYFCFLNTALRELVLPSSIESIETLAFANDPLDKIVSYITNPMAINNNTFDHSYERATLYVPAGSKEKYEATDGWKLFKKIVEMGGEVPPGNIAFADAPVKVVCLENWDTNGDGYLSFEEAAAVKDLGQAFRLNWQITSFDELQYFTGLTNIAEQAFSNCDHLTSVVIPNSVTTIGYAAFNGCTSLTSVTIPESVDTIGGSAFQNCRSLTSVTIPNSVTSIGQTAFSGCKSLTSINIPESMTIIESAVFSACSSLTTITIPNSITRIKDHAFSGCTGLTEIRSYIEKPFFSHQGSWYNVDKSIPLYVPAGTKVKYQTTEYWYEFTNIIEMGGETPNLDPTLIQFADTEVKRICVENWDTNGDGELSYDEAAAVTSIGTVFRNNKVMTTFDELEYFTGLTEIGDNAFSWSSIESVKIPNNVTHIGEQAFRGSGMSSPIIPKSVTSIGKEAFSYNWLNSIVVEAGNTVYDSRDNCNAIIHTATNELVQGCANTTIPNSVTSIGDAAFLGCDGLKSISIPSSVTTIGNFAFKECHYLTDVSIPNSVTTIGIEAFEITGLSSVVIPNSVTYIGNNAFWGCSMTSLTIPNSITTIESETFMYCKSLTSVIIPNSITSIGWNAFCYCSALASVTSFIEIPRAINDGVFEYLPEDATLYVPAGSKARYESTDGWKNFKNIVEMEAVTPDPNDPNIKFADPKVKAICVANWDINGDHELSYDEAAAVTDLGRVFYSNHEILSFDELQYFTGLKVIGERAFSMCRELFSITLPNSLDSIERYAFFDCYYLTNINFGNSVKYIGDHAIGYCDNLPSVTIPNSVTTIDEWAFNGCLNLSSITIPNSVTSIGSNAFLRCPKLTEVYSYIKEPFSVYWPLGEESIPTLYVPAGTKAKYQATDGWKEFKNIVEMADE